MTRSSWHQPGETIKLSTSAEGISRQFVQKIGSTILLSPSAYIHRSAVSGQKELSHDAQNRQLDPGSPTKPVIRLWATLRRTAVQHVTHEGQQSLASACVLSRFKAS